MRLIDADAAKNKLVGPRFRWIRNFLNKQPTIEAAPRWIPVTERLPDDDIYVLVIVSGKPCKNVTLHNAVELAEYDPEGWILEMWPDWMDADVTHWMPLPEPPEGD